MSFHHIPPKLFHLVWHVVLPIVLPTDLTDFWPTWPSLLEYTHPQWARSLHLRKSVAWDPGRCCTNSLPHGWAKRCHARFMEKYGELTELTWMQKWIQWIQWIQKQIEMKSGGTSEFSPGVPSGILQSPKSSALRFLQSGTSACRKSHGHRSPCPRVQDSTTWSRLDQDISRYIKIQDYWWIWYILI